MSAGSDGVSICFGGSAGVFRMVFSCAYIRTFRPDAKDRQPKSIPLCLRLVAQRLHPASGDPLADVISLAPLKFEEQDAARRDKTARWFRLVLCYIPSGDRLCAPD